MISDNETIEDHNEGWKIRRSHLIDEQYIYEFWHKPLDKVLPFGRYVKYVQEGDDIIVIEDGPYLGDRND